MTNRRIFLRNSALAMVGAGTAPLWLQRALYAKDAPSPRKKILVAIFQRGAADGLNVVVPHAEKAYYALRPTISIPRPTAAAGKRDDAAIDLDGFFGFHPALAPLKRRQARRCRHRPRRLLRLPSGARAPQAALRPGHLAVVDAVGSP